MFKRWVFRLFLALLVAINVGAAIQAFQYIAVLAYPEGYQPALTLPLPVVGSVHIVLALSCLAILIVQWQVKQRKLIFVWAVGYQVVNWVLYLLGEVSTYARILWVRKALLTLLFFLVLVWLTHIRARKKKIKKTE